MIQPIFRWSGKYFGFIWQNRLFDEESNYVTWNDGIEVWKKDGTYLGDLFENTYILRPTKIEKLPCKPKITQQNNP